MSFLKKHWYIPAAVLLVLSGVIGLYMLIAPQQPIEPQTTYVMPEQTSNEPPAINTGTAQRTTFEAYTRPEPPDDVVGPHESHQPADTTPSDEVNEPPAPQKPVKDAVPVKSTSDTTVSDDELAKQLAHFEEFQRDHEQLVAEGESWLSGMWDDTAKELRPKSIAERQSFLSEMRAGLESDEEPEWIDWYIKNLISAMNERGVYFE